MVQSEKEGALKNFKDQIKWGVDTLMTLSKSFPKKSSLLDDGEPIFLQVSLFKIPQVDEMVKRRLSLKHSPYAGKPEVCLIVHDCLRKDGIKRTPDEMIDYTIAWFEDIFKKHNITGITNILPYYQLKTEYNTFELRRKLVNRFDVFLCSSSLNSQSKFFSCLGKPFIRKNKYPISVKLPAKKTEYSPKVNCQIQSAIASTVFRIKEGSDNYSMRVGNTLNKKKEIKENLELILDKIINSDFIPGGLENIRFIGIKTGKSKVVPLYISMSSGNKVRVPYVEPNYPLKESVEDELSTIPGKKVTVLPSGEVFVTPMHDSLDKEDDDLECDEDDDKEGDEEEDENSQVEEENETFYIKKGKAKSKENTGKKKGKRYRENESDDEDDEEDAEGETDAFEQKYLSNWNEERESSEEEEEQVKPKKGRKQKQKATGKMEKKESSKPPYNVKKGESQPAKKMKKNKTLKANEERKETPPVKKMKNEARTDKLKDKAPPPKKTEKKKILMENKGKKVDIKPTEVVKIQGKMEKEKNIKNPSNKTETLDAKKAKQKKILDVKTGKKKMLEAKMGKKMEKAKAKINGIEKKATSSERRKVKR